MLESDANQKICPIMSTAIDVKYDQAITCRGLGCMMWEEHQEPVREESKQSGSFTIQSKIIGSKPLEPSQGHCGMIPPELYCEGR